MRAVGRLALALAALATLAATGAHAGEPAAASPAPTARICDLKNAAMHPGAADRRVTVVGPVWYDFEHGYFLADQPACQDRFDNTDILRIELAPGADIGDFPELLQVSSQAFLRANTGKLMICTCGGKVIYADGVATFVLTSAKVTPTAP
jgi:hypothetical protein